MRACLWHTRAKVKWLVAHRKAKAAAVRLESFDRVPRTRSWLHEGPKLDRWLAIAARLARLCRGIVRAGVLRRSPPAVSEPHLVAPAGLQHGAGRVLLVVDVLRRGRHRSRLEPVVPADLPWADPAVRVRQR